MDGDNKISVISSKELPNNEDQKEEKDDKEKLRFMMKHLLGTSAMCFQYLQFV